MFKISEDEYYILDKGVLVPREDMDACMDMARLIESKAGMSLHAIACMDGGWVVRAIYLDHVVGYSADHRIRTEAPSLRLALSVIVKHLGLSWAE